MCSVLIMGAVKFRIGSRCARFPFRIAKGSRTRGCDITEGRRVTGLHQVFDPSIHGVKAMEDVDCHCNKLESVEGFDEVEDFSWYVNTAVTLEDEGDLTITRTLDQVYEARADFFQPC